jgi:triacylglycerol lipase
VSTRSRQLAEVIRTLPGERVNVIAHSMGGVDARVAIARLGCAERVASLVTLATPHHGTPLADLSRPFLRGNRRERAAEAREPDAPRARRKKRSVDVRGLVDARPEAMKRLNRRIRDDARVHYASVISAVDGVRGVHPLLVPEYLYLSGAAGRNDGVVPETSQAWGDVLAQVESDHWGVVGWSRKFDAKDFYREILRELAGRGF